VRDLRIGSPLVLRGEASAPAAEAHGVSFRLTKSGYPVLIHVDGAGAVRLLHPASGAPPTRLGKDRLALLPPGGADAWRADLAPGTETYLLAVATREPPDPRSLQSLLGGLDPLAGADDPRCRRASLRVRRRGFPPRRSERGTDPLATPRPPFSPVATNRRVGKPARVW
jgi:hypothetical protein